ncbi:MAG: hypothetical protein QXW00_03905, partial [Candidatus Woesearchaeota archaeon]
GVGGFGMVDVYVEGLRPRVLGEFERLGRPVPKREVKRLSDEELAKQRKLAEQSRAEFIKKMGIKEQQSKQEEKKEEHIVQPYTFDNGAMVSELKELKDAIEPMSADILRSALSGNNKLSDWIKNELKNEQLASEIEKAKTKKEILDAITAELDKAEKSSEKSGTDKGQKSK